MYFDDQFFEDLKNNLNISQDKKDIKTPHTFLAMRGSGKIIDEAFVDELEKLIKRRSHYNTNPLENKIKKELDKYKNWKTKKDKTETEKRKTGEEEKLTKEEKEKINVYTTLIEKIKTSIRSPSKTRSRKRKLSNRSR